MGSKKHASTFGMRLAQLLFAVSPLTDGNDTLFYACVSTAATLFLVFITTTVIVCKEEKWNTIVYISGNRITNSIDCVIGIIGIIVCRETEFIRLSYYWWTYFAISLISLIGLLKMNESK